MGSPYPFSYNWPGIVATLALVMINLLPRRDLAEAGDSLEEGGEVRLVLGRAQRQVHGCASARRHHLVTGEGSSGILGQRGKYTNAALLASLHLTHPRSPAQPSSCCSSAHGSGCLCHSSLRQARWRAAWPSSLRRSSRKSWRGWEW